MSTLEHSARVAHAREVLARPELRQTGNVVELVDQRRDLIAALELLLEADDPAKVEQARLWWIADDAISSLLAAANRISLLDSQDAPGEMVRTRAERLRDRLGPTPGERP